MHKLHKKRDFWLMSTLLVSLGMFVGYLLGLGVTTTGSAIYQESCFDSDGGKNLGAYGYTLSSGERLFDYCKSSQLLVEYYCDSDKSKEFYHRCAYGCEAGKCLS